MAQKPINKKSSTNNKSSIKKNPDINKQPSKPSVQNVAVKEKPANPTGGISDFFKNFDFKTVLNTFSDLVTNYKTAFDIMKNSLTNANELFGKVKQENFNISLGFFVLSLGIMMIFEFINNLLAGKIASAVSVIVFMLIFWPILCLIVVIIAHFILKLIGSKGTLIDTAKVACYTSWLGIILSFPLMSILGVTLNTLIALACMAMCAFIWIKGSIIVLEMNKDRSIMVIGGITGVLILLGLIGLFVS